MNIQRLTDKVALVTGGSRGIGAAIVRRLASEGASVSFTYAASRQAADALVAEIEDGGGRALAIEADSGDSAQVEAAVSETVQAFGRLDVLVNSAGMMILNTVDEYSLADFDRMFAVNVRAAFVAVKASVPHLRDGGRIVIIGSVVAERAGIAGGSIYSMTKSALVGMSRGLARDLGPRGITINVVQPGPTETDLTDDHDMREMIRPLMPIGRMGQGAEVASLVAYLASPEASFVTGSAMTVDGGFLA